MRGNSARLTVDIVSADGRVTTSVVRAGGYLVSGFICQFF